MKKFINRPKDVVEEMLEGMVMLHPGLAVLPGYSVIVRADAKGKWKEQVAIISGGGSGHEPAHAGYVGMGMLSAAVAGEVFTSPSSDSVFAAIKAVATQRGVLLVVKNYTGDRLNFGLAAEMARADGIPVKTVIVDDDIALKAADQATGARGLAGTILVHKLVGAAAAEGRSLEDVASVGEAAVRSLATMGVSFSAGTSPTVGKPSFQLGEHEMELGLGIHGEPGVKRAELQPADELTETLLDQILKYGEARPEKRVAVLVNNLGAVTQMELAIVSRHALSYLESKGLTVERIYAGTFLSSLDMAGISISVLGVDDERLRWLDAETTAPAWPNVPKQRPSQATLKVAADISSPATSKESGTGSKTAEKTKLAIEAACKVLIDAEDELTEIDRITGDGDLGTSMSRGAKAIQSSVSSLPLDDAPGTLKVLGRILARELGGSSGPLYGALFLRCGNALEGARSAGLAQWIEALDAGCEAISELGGAKPGDRTMLDALYPFAQTLKKTQGIGSAREAILSAVEAADDGMKATMQMKPRLGRSSYLGDRVIGYPDPGAKAITIWLRCVCETLFPSQGLS